MIERLNDFRVPVGKSIKLTFARRVRLDGQEDAPEQAEEDERAAEEEGMGGDPNEEAPVDLTEENEGGPNSPYKRLSHSGYFSDDSIHEEDDETGDYGADAPPPPVIVPGMPSQGGSAEAAELQQQLSRSQAQTAQLQQSNRRLREETESLKQQLQSLGSEKQTMVATYSSQPRAAPLLMSAVC